MKYSLVFLLLYFFTVNLVAQNVGINSLVPQTTLDVTGALALREGPALNLLSGINNDVALGATSFSFYRITGPILAFTVTGFANGKDGELLTIWNTSTQTMTINNLGTSSANNQILTLNSKPLVINSNGLVSMQYAAGGINKWIVLSYNNELMIVWSLLGNRGITQPAVPATYGTSKFGSTENWIGTTGTQDFVVGTDSVERLRVKGTNGNIGIGTASPNTNAIVDIFSTTRGVLFPRMTEAQRNAIPAPPEGLHVYNSDEQCLNFWDLNLGTPNKWNSYCHYCEVAVVITSNQTNFDFNAYLVANSLRVGPYNYCVTINPGVDIIAAGNGGGNSVSGNSAFNMLNMPDGAKVFINNYGRIVGGGANGGRGGVEGNNVLGCVTDQNGGGGGAGGHAIITKNSVVVRVTNYGLIGGGGGGGGGGDPGCCSAGGGGGGGAGMPVGSGGGNNFSQCASGIICTSCSGSTFSANGTAGNVPVGIANAGGGGGGANASENSPCGPGNNGNFGGNGGSLGANGVSAVEIPLGLLSCSDNRTAGGGGAAGKAIGGGQGNSIFNRPPGIYFGTVD